jgi:hypothetical protein
MPSGQQQEPGGWNRVVLKVVDLPGFVAELKKTDRQIVSFATGWKPVRVVAKSK